LVGWDLGRHGFEGVVLVMLAVAVVDEFFLLMHCGGFGGLVGGGGLHGDYILRMVLSLIAFDLLMIVFASRDVLL
jgi:hypothetical protein